MSTSARHAISAKLPPQLGDAVVRLQRRGYSDTEIIKRGVRLLAREEGIPIDEVPA